MYKVATKPAYEANGTKELRASEESHAVSRGLWLLGSEPRLRILMALLRHPWHTVNIESLSEIVGISQPAVSHHITMLHAAGLLEYQKSTLYHYYAVRIDKVQEIWDDFLQFSGIAAILKEQRGEALALM